MNYQQIYNKIIENAKNSEVYDKRFSIENYIEKHHILPKSFGGSDSHENLVNLTAREHYLCHALLMKIAKQNYSLNKSEKTLKEYRQMWYAFNMMNISISSSQKRYFNSKLFEVFKNGNLLEKEIIHTGTNSILIKGYFTSSDKVKIVTSINGEEQAWAKVSISKIAISDMFLLIFSLFLWLLVLFLTFRKNQAAITLGVYVIFLLSIYAENTTFNQIDIKSLLANGGILIAIALLLALIFNFSRNIKITTIIALFTGIIFFVLAFVPLMFISYKLASHSIPSDL